MSTVEDTLADTATSMASRHGKANDRPWPDGTVVIGVSGLRRNAAVAAAVDGRLVSVCEQERMTRMRGARPLHDAFPHEALGAVLARAGRCPADVEAFVTAEDRAAVPAAPRIVAVEHHWAHAATAVLTSPCTAAAVLVCDRHSAPSVSIWRFDRGHLQKTDWTWSGPGFAEIYSDCARLFGFESGSEHRLESISRIASGECDAVRGLVAYNGGGLVVHEGWRTVIAEILGENGSADVRRAAIVASSFQRALGDALVDLVRDIRASVPCDALCLGGGLFYNTYLNTRVVASRAFGRVFVPLNPGNPGLAAGAALAVGQGERLHATPASPFLGPEFSPEEIKETLDNCKLTYEYLMESQVIDVAVEALRRGALVGWFQGAMEWGHRALGHRSILADPFSPYVLDNLNRYLKRREPYRGYGVSVCADEAERHFRIPAASDYMELEYAPLKPESYHILPPGARTLRVQTVREDGLFADLHRAFAAVHGAGVLVNTSFNGFHEPIVCSPRDAVRVFFGTGLDVLVLGRFVLRK